MADVRERERMLLDYAKHGLLSWSWSKVAYEEDGHRVEFLVQAQGMMLEGIHLSMSATLSQQIADLHSMLLPTAKIGDIVYRAANVKLPPKTQVINATRAGIVEQSQKLDAAIAGRATALVADMGKDWVLSNKLKPEVAANYGWHVDTNPWGGIHTDPAVTYPAQPGAWVIQSVGTRHSPQHVDYSQISRLVSRQAAYDGQPIDLGVLLQSPAASILSSEGPLKYIRQPGVPDPRNKSKAKAFAAATVAAAAIGAVIL